jgi:division protein CdvB (Snf7/Vps24/ESCRT-III family)
MISQINDGYSAREKICVTHHFACDCREELTQKKLAFLEQRAIAAETKLASTRSALEMSRTQTTVMMNSFYKRLRDVTKYLNEIPNREEMQKLFDKQIEDLLK